MKNTLEEENNHFYYAPASIDRRHIVFGLSVCLSVCPFVCPQKLLHWPYILICKSLGLHISHEYTL